MAFELDSLEQTRQQIGSDIETYLPGTQAQTRRSAVGVISYAQAGAVRGLQAHIEYRARNFLPDEDADAEGVERWARMFGLWYRDATAAGGNAVVVGTSGAVLPAGTLMQSTQGLVFITDAEVVLVDGAANVGITAQDAGSAGNMVAGAKLTLLNPVPGVQSQLTVAPGDIGGGEDPELLGGLRTRVLNRLRKPPQGGSLADYITWALEAHPSVTRVWVTEHEQGAGSITVRVVCDNEVSPIPSSEVIDAVTAYIDVRRQAGRKSIYVLPPVADLVDYQIKLKPDSSAVRVAVEAELRDLHRREAAPGSNFLISHISEAISIATGEFDHELQSPVADLEYDTGVMPVFGAIAWL